MTVSATSASTSPVMSSEPPSSATSPFTSPVMGSAPLSARTPRSESTNASSGSISTRSTPSIIVSDVEENGVVVVGEERTLAQRFSTLLEVSEIVEAILADKKNEKTVARPTTAAQRVINTMAPKNNDKKFEWKR